MGHSVVSHYVHGTLSGGAVGCYQLRVRQLHHQFDMTLQARVGERTRIARKLHDTLLQSFHGVLLRLETGSQLLREHPHQSATDTGQHG
jgi:signal transduction histidine kinase